MLWPEALAFWEELQRRGVMPNISNYNSVINAFCKKGRISVASNLLKDALDKGLIPDVITYRALIKAHYEAGNIQEAS